MNSDPRKPRTAASKTHVSHVPGPAERIRRRRKRRLADHGYKYLIGAGGISVIVALFLIFVFLAIEVLPMLKHAKMDLKGEYPSPDIERESVEVVADAPNTFHIAMERYMDVAVRFSNDGQIIFFNPANGEIISRETLELPEGVGIVSSAIAEPRTRLVALGLSDGTAIVVRHDYDITYPDGVQLVTPKLTFPLERDPVIVDENGSPLEQIAVQEGTTGGIVVAGYSDDGRLTVIRYDARRDFLTQAVTLTRTVGTPPVPDERVQTLAVSITLADLIIGDFDGKLSYYNIRDIKNPVLQDSRRVVDDGITVSAMDFLLGSMSIIVGGSDGSVTQWMLVRDDETNERYFARIRSFQGHEGPVVSVRPEYSRKGFVTSGVDGRVGVHFATSGRTLLMEKVADVPLEYAMLSPRANGLLVASSDDSVRFFEVANRHPQVSWQALWGKVHYEGYAETQYRWESSSATDEFEPKFSLVPLTIGTLKAAAFAMLFAIPIAILGAIYSAYFMTPKMRGMVKPCIEIMEALPTVILGFLAGLWLAPFVQGHLPAMALLLICVPASIILASMVWMALPKSVHQKIPDGWEAAMLIPVILFTGWACVSASPIIEVAFFGGDARQWLNDQGISYDDRNALIVGMAMGFAVIPTIFSISEDAIFSVPKHLTQGSLALGATRWQTMIGVVLLTASPGLFSAVMIGMGRAVGETMIVLMASGNSPVVDWSMFQGLRTLSANIAVEMPETEVGGTHYRILFLSALFLFALTFMFNTVAEVVRQRLRKKYSSL